MSESVGVLLLGLFLTAGIIAGLHHVGVVG